LLGWEIKRMNDGDGVGIWNRDKQIGVIVERSGPEKQLAAEWITGYMVGVLEKQCAIATRRLGSEQQRMSKMAYGVGPDGIPFVLIN